MLYVCALVQWAIVRMGDINKTRVVVTALIRLEIGNL